LLRKSFLMNEGEGILHLDFTSSQRFREEPTGTP
jgi:hypothetical protein